MKVLHIFRTYFPETTGGIEEVIKNIVLSTKCDNLVSDILTVHSKNNSISKEEYSCVYYTKRNFTISHVDFSISCFIKFLKINKSYDILHLHFPWPFADLLALFSSRKTKIIITYHCDILRNPFLYFFYRPFLYLFLKKVDHICVSSEPLYNNSRVISKFKSKCSVVPFALPLKPDYDYKPLKGKYWVFVGMLRKYKGLDVLVNAMQETKENLILVGDGPEKSRIINLVKKLGLNERIQLAGRVSDREKFELLSKSKGFILPSITNAEAFGMSILEALRYEKPVISTELGTGTSWVNLNNDTGFVVPPSNPKELAHAINKISGSPELWNKFSKNAGERFKELFVNEKMGSKYLTIYNNLLKNN